MLRLGNACASAAVRNQNVNNKLRIRSTCFHNQNNEADSAYMHDAIQFHHVREQHTLIPRECVPIYKYTFGIAACTIVLTMQDDFIQNTKIPSFHDSDCYSFQPISVLNSHYSYMLSECVAFI